ncbi:flagellar biosynthesis protein FlgD [Malaciobacter halophilus]|uniref:Basal-body rod modification protein FlgD n=1 Tax=Malaciobacter halophilus TaxID=197482 RepID=A0A2N1IZU5_9BACT|nr:flagellar hook capping FlgD N-terminal domain-containing protein [Malaciobacter halophilus]AXH10492.1 flagellar hook assembly protein [Malaciobacter halophilus]PKI79812.1 flagellar biosynthesis protein FlgD [Malaciobacter halophilus]
MYTGNYTGTYSDDKYNQIKNRDANGYTTRDVTTNSKTDASGNSYTTSISNDQLSNSDFLNLMIQELKLQDPTKPMDSQRMMDSQLQMSTMETNRAMAASMEKLVATFNQTSLSNATNMIGKNIEDINTDDNGVSKAYRVLSVETMNDQLVVKARQILYMEDIVKDADGNRLMYDADGFIYNEDGEKTGEKIVLKNPGQIATDKDGKPMILDENNETVEDHEYVYEGMTTPVFSSEISTIPFENITKVF